MWYIPKEIVLTEFSPDMAGMPYQDFLFLTVPEFFVHYKKSLESSVSQRIAHNVHPPKDIFLIGYLYCIFISYQV